MKIFADTARLEDVRKLSKLGLIDGVTTNPSLIALALPSHDLPAFAPLQGAWHASNPLYAHYKALCSLVSSHLSAELVSLNSADMLKEARLLAGIDEKIVVKVPMIEQGLDVMRQLKSEGIRTNCTLVFNPHQALVAAKVGASYVSPFVGRVEDMGYDGLNSIEEIRDIFDNYNIETEILCASVRHKEHFLRVALIGADIVTCPPALIMSLIKHPLTDAGLAQFMADFKRQTK